jgi:hypothetical protein
MIGGTKDEGAMFVPQFVNDPDRLDDVNTDFDLQGVHFLSEIYFQTKKSQFG